MKDASDRQDLLKADRTPAPIFLDDWQGTIRITKQLAYDFISHAATTMASAGLVVYFLMQGDTTAAYGLKELGAMMKNNFMNLTIIPIPDQAGLIVPGQSRAELVYPNTTAPVPVDLIPGRPRCFPDPAAGVIEAQAAESEKSPEDKIRAALTDDPTLGIGKLQTIGWGSKGGKKHQERSELIASLKQEIGVS